MTTSEYGQRDYQVWVMPYETVEGAPLGRMYPLIRMARTVDVTTTVTIRAENTEIPHSARSMSSSINALTLQTVQSTSLWVPTIPGRINRLRLRVDLDAGDGVGIASVSWGPRQAIRDL